MMKVSAKQAVKVEKHISLSTHEAQGAEEASLIDQKRDTGDERRASLEARRLQLRKEAKL